MAAGNEPAPACPIPDLGPDTYARWRASSLGAITEDLQHALVLRLIGDVTGRSVLDVGCGDGKLAVELARRGAHVTAVDVSPAMIEAARTRAAAAGVRLDLRLAATQALPFAASQFDIVTAITILCFVADAKPAFAEIARVLKPGGRLVIGELNRWSTWAAERRLRAWLGSALWRQGRFRTPQELRGLASGAGLVPQSVMGATFYPRIGWAARAMRPLDAPLGRLTTVGAAFIALSATKPRDPV